MRPRPRLGCAPGAPFLGRRAAGPAPGGAAVSRNASPGPHPQDRIRRPGHRGSRDRRVCPAAAPPWLHLTPYLDPPTCPHAHIVQSSNPLCNHEINEAERGPGECGGEEDRGLGAPVSCKSCHIPATRSHTPAVHQPHSNCTPATCQSHTSHTSSTHQPHTPLTPATLQLHTSFTSAHTGKEVTCSKPSPSAWPSRVERVL